MGRTKAANKSDKPAKKGKTPVLEEYFQLQALKIKEFGPKTILLCQIGTFFEVYEDDQELGFSREVAHILNITLTQKNGTDTPVSRENPRMCGFPTAAYPRHKTRLLKKGYNLVIYVQESKDPYTDKVTRGIREVVSSTTDIDAETSNYIAVIYIECQEHKRLPIPEYQVIVGLAALDVTTGKNMLSESYSKDQDPQYVWDDVYRFLLSLSPQQVIVYLDNIPNADNYQSFLEKRLHLSKYKTVDVYPVNSTLTQNVYMEQTIKRLGLDKELLHYKRYGLVAYFHLLKYVSSYNPMLSENLEKPETSFLDTDRHLTVTNNALGQLHVFASGNKGKKMDRGNSIIDSLFSLINETVTHIGARYLRRMLSYPATDPEALENYYNMTEDFVNNQDLLSHVADMLKKLPDIERLQRKALTCMIKPLELFSLFSGYIVMSNIYNTINTSNCEFLKQSLFTTDQCTKFEALLNYALQKVNLTKLGQIRLVCDSLEISESFLQEGVNAEIDSLNQSIQILREKIQAQIDYLNSFFQPTKAYGVYLESPSADRRKEEETEVKYQLLVSKAKAPVLMAAPTNASICGKLKIDPTRKKEKFSVGSEVINSLLDSLNEAETKLREVSTIFYKAFIKELIGYISEVSQQTVEFIAKIDYVKAAAIMRKKYHYFRPTLDKDSSGPSYVNLKQLRHPIIEQIISHPYVPNDVELGLSTKGLLLFSSNACGKSSLTKAIGLCVIMAQAGLPVPAEMTYRPYKRILTRLSGHDDLFAGKSKFEIEMEEAHIILKNIDEQTLVLMDEVTSGSEIVSGLSVSITLLEKLLETGASFIFPTHLHTILKLKHISTALTDPRLRICHLSGRYDEATDTFIYERKLKDGQGLAVYGVEVCRSLHMPRPFIQRANEIRSFLCDDLSILPEGKPSRYNSQILVERCEVCGTKDNLQTHHLREQHFADKNGYIDIHHKNRSYNLQVLCRNCHERTHDHESCI